MDFYDHARLASQVRERDAFEDILNSYPAGEAQQASRDESLPALGFDEQLFAKRIQTIYKIEEKRTGAMLPWGPLLKSNPLQLRYMKRILGCLRKPGPVRIIVIKSRKPGISTASALMALEACIQVKGYNAGIIAHSDTASQTLFRIVQRAYEGFPKEDRPELRKERADMFQFGVRHREEREQGAIGSGSIIQAATAKGAYPFSGATMRWLILSECAKYDTVGDMNAQMRFILSALGSVPSVGHSVVIAESTANGQSGWAWETWKRATSKAASGDGITWVPIFISWLDDQTNRMPVNPDYDWTDWPSEDIPRERELVEHHKASLENLMFRRFQLGTTMNMDFDYFSQEFPTTADEAFLTSGRLAFPKRYMDAQQKNFRDPIATYDVEVTDSDAATTTYEVQSASRQNLP